MTQRYKQSELFELCKKVYEKTGWIVGDESWDWHTTTDAKLDSMFIVPLITADRKRVELEARLDENNMYIRELTRHYFPSGPDEPYIPLVQFHERIAEIKAQHP